eukprot:2449044-Lingulodinium_polyedra.AAC.1
MFYEARVHCVGPLWRLRRASRSGARGPAMVEVNEGEVRDAFGHVVSLRVPPDLFSGRPCRCCAEPLFGPSDEV